MSTLTIRYTESEIVELGRLPKGVRDEVEEWIRHLCGDPRNAARYPGVKRPIHQSLCRIASSMGVSVKTARRKYDALRRALASCQNYAWRVLINRAKSRDESQANFTPEFIEWYRKLVGDNQRKSRPAWRIFQKRWQAGEHIPGLDNSLPRHQVPPGCTYGNLQNYKPTRLELTATRIGRSAAAPYLPKTFSKRSDLYVGSHYLFDDLWHDNFTAFKGKPVRVLEFDALDVFSSCKFAWGVQPRIERADGSMEGLKEKQMRMLLAKCLFQDGYSERGTELLAEHGTAAIAERIEQLLFDRTNGIIRTRRSGITGAEQAVTGMFQGRGKGNPRFKAALESLRNLIHNELGALPAQTGMDVSHRPERLHGELQYTADILKLSELLPPARRALLRLPMLEFHSQFIPLLMDVYRAINDRTWHELEGWSECGHITIEYRLSPDSPHWLTGEQYLQLPAEVQNNLAVIIHQDPRYFQQRQLSPAEVWHTGRAQLKRLPAFVVSEILGPDFSREEPVKGAYFEFEDSDICPGILRFESRVTDPEGREAELRDGSKWQVFINPFDLGQLFVHDASGRHIGIARRDRAVSRLDTKALQSQWGRVAKRESDLLAPLRKRHADWSKEQINMRENNAQVFADDAKAETDLQEAARANLRKAANMF